MNTNQIRIRLVAAMREPDRWVIVAEYAAAGGLVTRRTISPIRFVGQHTVLALCLCREQPRQFKIDGFRSAKLVPADSVLMPVAIEKPLAE